MGLFEWIADRKLTVKQCEGNVYEVDGKRYLHVFGVEGIIITPSNTLALTDVEKKTKTDFYLFRFGEYWFYTKSAKQVEFNEFNYLGAKDDCGLAYLGVHSGHELCSGSGSYKNWVRKAKQLGYLKLAICENTLSGAIQFQKECESQGIVPVVGETLIVDGVFIKAYVKDDIGWRNLLNLHKLFKIDHPEGIPFEKFTAHTQGLVIVLDKSADLGVHGTKFRNVCHHVYYQFDIVNYANDTRDIQGLEIIKRNYIHPFDIKPVFIADSYYIHKSESYIRRDLAEIAHEFCANADNQYFKTPQDWIEEVGKFVKNDNFCDQVLSNTMELSDQLGAFRVKVKKEFYLPEYIMNDHEKAIAKDNVELIWHYITQGLAMPWPIQHQWEEVEARIAEEMSVIGDGGFVDYFLIISDIIKWARSQGILVGMGRGSVGGSLISYILGITDVNPLDHGLLFERFLNKGRIGKSLPDIDVDFQASRREEVKKYIEQKYGENHVCSIGSYTTFKLKQSIKDFARLDKVSIGTVNYATAMVEVGDKWEEIVDLSHRKKPFKDFVQKNYAMFNKLYVVSGQQRSASVHAAGIVIVPKSYKGKEYNVWDWMPVKKMDGVMVSEFDGVDIEEAGFLKADILGLKQLDKFADIFALIKQNHNIELSWTKIPFDSSRVFRAFAKGFNQDVFQFQGEGMAVYSKSLKPDNIHDLIAMNALYRPGVMDINAHMDYLDLKKGVRQPKYDFGLESVTKSTFGLYIYQEQIMQAVRILGGFSLTDADEIRKAMGKKIKAKMDSYKEAFVKGAVKNNCPELEAVMIWEKLENFSRYGFNQSHATTYAMMGYVSQYLKVFYPIEFWSVSLKHSDSEEISSRVEEMGLIGNIQICPPDINKSGLSFAYDINANKIYWAINKIDQIGDVAVTNIMEERAARGKFFSLEEAIKRLPKAKVDKRVFLNMILSGCFDEIENVIEPKFRHSLVLSWAKIYGCDLPDEVKGLSVLKDKNYAWVFLQKMKSGIGSFEYRKLLSEHNIPSDNYLRDSDIYNSDVLDRFVTVCGVVTKIITRKGKKGDFVIVNLEGNSRKFSALIWTETLQKFPQVIGSEGKLMALTGTVKTDKYNGGQSINSSPLTEIHLINI